MGGGGKSGNNSGQSKNYYGTIAGVFSWGADELVSLVVDGATVWPTNQQWNDGVVGLQVASYSRKGNKNKISFGVPHGLTKSDKFVTAGFADARLNEAVPVSPGTLSAYALQWTHVAAGLDVPDTPVVGATMSKVKRYDAGALVFWKGGVWQSNGTQDATSDKEPPNATWWTAYAVKLATAPNPYDFTVTGYGKGHFLWGTSLQTTHPLLNGHPPYRYQSALILEDFLFGLERQQAPNIELVLRRYPRQGVAGSLNALDAEGQANPLACGLDLLTDPIFGLGLDNSLFDAVSAAAIGGDLAAQAALTYISPILDKQITARSFLAQLLAYYDGWMRFNAQGKIEFGRFSHNEAPPVFADDQKISYHDIPKGYEIAYDPDSWTQTANFTVCKFKDGSRAFTDAGQPYHSGANREVTGELLRAALDRPWITRESQARLYAAEYGKIYAQLKMSGSIPVRAERAANIKAGDLFELTHDAAGLTVVCRCNQKIFAAPPAGRATLKFENERGIAPLPFVPTVIGPVGPTAPGLERIDLFQLLQPPPTLGVNVEFQLAALIARTSELTRGVKVWLRISDGANFYDLGQQTEFAVNGTLSQNYGIPVQGTTAQRGRVVKATVQRGRTSNVATLKVTAHGYVTGQYVAISGVGGTSYNSGAAQITVIDADHFSYTSMDIDEATTADAGGSVAVATLKVVGHGFATGLHVSCSGLAVASYTTSDAVIYVIDADHFSYASAGANEATTADAGGVVSPLQDDDSGTLQMTVGDFTVQQDLDRLVDSTMLTGDAVDDNATLVIVFRASDNAMEIMALKSIALVSGTYELAVRRAQLSSNQIAFVTGDSLWLVRRKDVVSYQHQSFDNAGLNGTAAVLRLQSFTAESVADLDDANICPDIDYVFTDPWAPVITWLSLEERESGNPDFANIVDLTASFGIDTTFRFSFRISSPVSNLSIAKLVARQGDVEQTLYAHSFKATPGTNSVVIKASFKLNYEGPWEIFAVAGDWSKRVVEAFLTAIGGGPEAFLQISSSACAPVTSSLPTGTYIANSTSFTMVLKTTTPGASVIYQVAYAHHGAAMGAWSAETTVASGATVFVPAKAQSTFIRARAHLVSANDSISTTFRYDASNVF